MCSILYKKRKCFILCKPIQKKIHTKSPFYLQHVSFGLNYKHYSMVLSPRSDVPHCLYAENTDITPWFYTPRSDVPHCLCVENTNITPWFYPPVLMFHTVSVLKTKTLLHGSITIFASLKMKDIRLFVLLNHKHSFCIIHTVIGLWSNDICRLHHSNFTMKSYSRQNKYHDARAN